MTSPTHSTSPLAAPHDTKTPMPPRIPQPNAVRHESTKKSFAEMRRLDVESLDGLSEMEEML
jgi:hypothetical protein